MVENKPKILVSKSFFKGIIFFKCILLLKLSFKTYLIFSKVSYLGQFKCIFFYKNYKEHITKMQNTKNNFANILFYFPTFVLVTCVIDFKSFL